MIIRRKISSLQLCSNQVEVWKQVWKPHFHTRHHLLLWKLMAPVLPTLNRLIRIIPGLHSACYLCGESSESVHHLLLKCPISRLVWRNSPWHIRIEAYEHLEDWQWISLMIGPNNLFPVTQPDKLQMSIFLVVAFEQI